MSVVPLILRDWWEDFDRPISRLWDQHFGSELNRDDLISRFSSRPSLLRSFFPANSCYRRPWRLATRENSSGSSTIQLDKDHFQVILDVQQFLPDEITVKTVDNNIIVEAKHEEKQDEHGYVSRQFVRRYVLPEEHDVKNVTSTLSTDGVLTIIVPRKSPTPTGHERVIEIVKTGVPAGKEITIETKTN